MGLTLSIGHFSLIDAGWEGESFAFEITLHALRLALNVHTDASKMNLKSF